MQIGCVSAVLYIAGYRVGPHEVPLGVFKGFNS